MTFFSQNAAEIRFPQFLVNHMEKAGNASNHMLPRGPLIPRKDKNEVWDNRREREREKLLKWQLQKKDNKNHCLICEKTNEKLKVAAASHYFCFSLSFCLFLLSKPQATPTFHLSRPFLFSSPTLSSLSPSLSFGSSSV